MQDGEIWKFNSFRFQFLACQPFGIGVHEFLRARTVVG